MQSEDVDCPTTLEGFIQLYWQDRRHIIIPMHDDWKTWRRWVTLVQGGLIVLGVVAVLAKSQNLAVRQDLIQQSPPPLVSGKDRR